MLDFGPFITPLVPPLASHGLTLLQRWFPGARRGARNAAYRGLINSVEKAQLRIDVLHGLHAARGNPVNLPAVWAGFAPIVTVVDGLTADLADVLETWRTVQSVALPPTARQAEVMLHALADLVKHADPGPLRPLRRQRVKRAHAEAMDTYRSALRHFTLSAQSESGRFRERAAARAELKLLAAGSSR
jgi:hypothetical protein